MMARYFSRCSWLAAFHQACIALGILSFAWLPVAFAAQVVYYPQGHFERSNSVNYRYSIEVLKLAIEKTGLPITLVAVPTILTQPRKLSEMRDGRSFDVYWSVTTKQLEKDLIPIRICLFKGLNGWRIPVVTLKNQDLLARVKTLDDLRKFSAGTGITWSDTKALTAAGLPVRLSYDSFNLFNMLAADRFDYFPRGVQEVWSEIDENPTRFDADFVTDTHIVLRYPNPHYFFVRRDKPELAETIRVGLEMAIKDGSFDELFYKYFSESILRSQLEKRRIIEIPNPELPAETPLDRKNLWFSLDDLTIRGKLRR